MKEVTGSLQVLEPFQAPSLISVGRYLWLDDYMQAPRLTMVGKDLAVHQDFHAPALMTVGGDIEVKSLNDIECNFYVPALLKSAES